jgi:hypothetical protein
LNTLHLFFALATVSLLGMTLVDMVLGSKAEFLSAFSVLQRIVGRTPSAGDSIIAQKLGAIGELIVVLAANLAIAGVFTLLVWFFVLK